MGFLWIIFRVFVLGPFKSRQDLKLEIIVLRQQLIVLHRKAPGRPVPSEYLISVWILRILRISLSSRHGLPLEHISGFCSRYFQV